MEGFDWTYDIGGPEIDLPWRSIDIDKLNDSEKEKLLKVVSFEKSVAVKHQKYALAAELRDIERKLENKEPHSFELKLGESINTTQWLSYAVHTYEIVLGEEDFEVMEFMKNRTE